MGQRRRKGHRTNGSARQRGAGRENGDQQKDILEVVRHDAPQKERNTYLIPSNIARGMTNNTTHARLGRAPSHKGLAHKRLTRSMLLLAGRADLNGVGPLLQLLACFSRLLSLLRHLVKARRQGKGPKRITTNRRWWGDRHGLQGNVVFE